MKSLIFVTGNQYKFEIAKQSLGKIGVEVVQQKLETPEIQSIDVSEVSAYSAKWAAEKLGKAVVVTDTGYYIEALHGFPGPYVKYINKWLTADDLLRLMEGKTNRKMEVRISMSYCEPNLDPVTFSITASGTIGLKAGIGTPETSSMDRVFIPEGFDKVTCEIQREKMVEFWKKRETYWDELAKYLSK